MPSSSSSSSSSSTSRFHLPRLPTALHTLRTFLRTFSLTLLYISAPYLYITRYHVSRYRITGPSMSPTLSPSYHETRARDHVLFWKNVRAPSQSSQVQTTAARETDDRVLRRGQIIVFHTPHVPDKMAVKRIVAMAGDEVRPLRRIGSPYYRDETETEGESQGCAPAPVTVTVPYNHVWVEGDNADASADSNDYGPVSLSLVDGVAGPIVWPLARAGWTDWERDGWEKRCKRRIKWRGRGREGVVPEEWWMH